MADGIDLLNVSFEGEVAPDRITARAGLEELKRVAPLRRYNDFNASVAQDTILSHSLFWVGIGFSFLL